MPCMSSQFYGFDTVANEIDVNVVLKFSDLGTKIQDFI